MATQPTGLVPLEREARTAAAILAIANAPDAHKNALAYEIARAPEDVLVQLAYREHAEPPFEHDDEDLARLAYAELDRRLDAKRRLLADNPAIAAALLARRA